MDRLFTNATMSFLSVYGRNLGKMAFGKTRVCGIVVGKHNSSHIFATNITFWY